mmetsp:Transcript_2878/g.4003  ORF Transcript_2878/g.4003 Transcript_2878/m.4003 type:complete len:218 (-) Transcript_2878:895-1548(-)
MENYPQLLTRQSLRLFFKPLWPSAKLLNKKKQSKNLNFQCSMLSNQQPVEEVHHHLVVQEAMKMMSLRAGMYHRQKPLLKPLPMIVYLKIYIHVFQVLVLHQLLTIQLAVLVYLHHQIRLLHNQYVIVVVVIVVLRPQVHLHLLLRVVVLSHLLDHDLLLLFLVVLPTQKFVLLTKFLMLLIGKFLLVVLRSSLHLLLLTILLAVAKNQQTHHRLVA